MQQNVHIDVFVWILWGFCLLGIIWSSNNSSNNTNAAETTPTFGTSSSASESLKSISRMVLEEETGRELGGLFLIASTMLAKIAHERQHLLFMMCILTCFVALLAAYYGMSDIPVRLPAHCQGQLQHLSNTIMVN